jgi:hypothetical protein
MSGLALMFGIRKVERYVQVEVEHARVEVESIRVRSGRWEYMREGRVVRGVRSGR